VWKVLLSNLLFDCIIKTQIYLHKGVHVSVIFSIISGHEVWVLNICLYLLSAVTGRVADDIQHMFLCLLLVSMVMLITALTHFSVMSLGKHLNVTNEQLIRAIFIGGFKVCGIDLKSKLLLRTCQY
jgi:hypothetical protein